MDDVNSDTLVDRESGSEGVRHQRVAESRELRERLIKDCIVVEEALAELPLLLPEDVPEGVDLTQNEQMAADLGRKIWRGVLSPFFGPRRDMFAGVLIGLKNAFDFYKIVDDKGDWDYKDKLPRGTPEGDVFGNWHYGYVTAAAKVPLELALRMAGRNQQTKRELYDPRNGAALDELLGTSRRLRCYGDDPRDTFWIIQGYMFYVRSPIPSNVNE